MKSRLCSHCTLISLVFFNLIVGLHCHFAIYLFPSLCSDRDVTLKGVIWCDFTPWSVTSCSCIDKIPKVAMASLKPKEIFFKKVKTRPHPPKRLIQTRPHMSTSRCVNSCVMPPKCSLKERRRGFINLSSVDAAVSGRRCVFLYESKITLFGLSKVHAIRNNWLRFVYNTPKCSNLCNAFYGWRFHEPMRVQGWLCTKPIKKKKK